METIKEEKKAEGIKIISVGQLMKSLIERGWLPRGDKEIVRAVYDVRHKMIGLYEDDGKKYFELVYKKSLRELVSTDSGLWQFVCENGMYKKNAGSIYFNDERAKNVFYKIDQFDEEGDVIQTGDMGGDEFIHISEPEYRIIESSLKDESELEEFLLSNIVIRNEE